MATVAIIGASQGIGFITANYLREQGHSVIGTSRKPKNETLWQLDVTDDSSIIAFTNRIRAENIIIDAVVYNAGYDLYSAAEDTTFKDLMSQLDTNFLGAVRLTQAILPIMRQQGYGKLIYLSSIGGLMALPFNSAYSASKFALEGYIESLRYELSPHNIAVSLIEPGQVKTDTLGTSIKSVDEISRYGVSSLVLAQNARDAGQQASLKPITIARTIATIIDHDAPKLRYLVGRQAKMVMLLKQWLPERIFERFIISQFVEPVLQQA